MTLQDRTTLSQSASLNWTPLPALSKQGQARQMAWPPASEALPHWMYPNVPEPVTNTVKHIMSDLVGV